MPLTIRPATERDQPTIHQIIRAARLPRLNVRWPNFIVAEEDREVVGVGQVKSHDDGSRELASIAVIPARQSQGIGSAIINTLLEREPGVLYLMCRRELAGYYPRFGFRLVEPTEYPAYFRRTTRLVNLMMRFLGTRIVVMRREAAG